MINRHLPSTNADLSLFSVPQMYGVAAVLVCCELNLSFWTVAISLGSLGSDKLINKRHFVGYAIN